MNTWTTRPYAVFSGVDQVEIFKSMATIQPARVIRRSSAPSQFGRQTVDMLPSTYTFDGEERDTLAFLRQVETTGLFVLHDQNVLLE